MGGEGLGRVCVVGVVDPEMTGLAAVNPRHLGEVELLGDVPDEHLLDLDGRIDEVHEGQVPEGVRETRGQGVELAAGEGDRLGEALPLAGQVGDARPEPPQFGSFVGQFEVEGHPQIAGIVETRLQRDELLVTHRAAQWGTAFPGLLVVELVGVVDRLDLTLANVGQGAAVVQSGNLRLQSRERGLLRLEGRFRLLEFPFNALELCLVDALLGLQHLPRREFALHLNELPLIPLPLPGIVEPDHPQSRKEQSYAGEGEDDVQPADVVSVAGSDFGQRKFLAGGGKLSALERGAKRRGGGVWRGVSPPREAGGNREAIRSNTPGRKCPGSERLRIECGSRHGRDQGRFWHG